jgi:quinol monooxygenase YgiN
VSNQISWRVELAVKPGELDNFRTLTEEMVESTREEPGVLIYERFVSDDGKVVHVYERYADSAAAVAHLREFVRKFGGRFVGMVDRRRFTVYGTPSDDVKGILDGFGATYMSPFGGFSQAA